MASFHQPAYGDYAVVLNDERIIGSVGLVPSIIPWGVFEPIPVSERHDLIAPEFGLFWAILPEQRRKGYAAEAAQMLIDYQKSAVKPLPSGMGI